MQEDDCDMRISAAYTFKIAISLMGFDDGILTASDKPRWQFQEGCADLNPV